MKKIQFLLLLFALVFTGCSSDDNENDSKLDFIQIKVTSEDITAPNGYVYLYRVSGHDLTSDEPNIWGIEYSPSLFYNYNGEKKIMLPISKNGTKYNGDLLPDKDNGYSVHSIYWSELSSIHGTPQPGDEYLVFVHLTNGNYAKASKRFTINKNSLITIKLPACEESQFVDAEWTISDYKE